MFVPLLSDLGHRWWRQRLRPFKPGGEQQKAVLPASLAQVASCQPVGVECPLQEAPYPRSNQAIGRIWFGCEEMII